MIGDKDEVLRQVTYKNVSFNPASDTLLDIFLPMLDKNGTDYVSAVVMGFSVQSFGSFSVSLLLRERKPDNTTGATKIVTISGNNQIKSVALNPPFQVANTSAVEIYVKSGGSGSGHISVFWISSREALPRFRQVPSAS